MQRRSVSPRSPSVRRAYTYRRDRTGQEGAALVPFTQTAYHQGTERSRFEVPSTARSRRTWA